MLSQVLVGIVYRDIMGGRQVLAYRCLIMEP